MTPESPAGITMAQQQIIAEYMRVANDFAQKLAAIDAKYDTYVRLEVIDHTVCVDHVGQSVCVVKCDRQIYVRDIILNGYSG